MAPVFEYMKKDITTNTKMTAKHSSENGLPMNIFDIHIENNGSKQELYEKIEENLKE